MRSLSFLSKTPSRLFTKIRNAFFTQTTVEKKGVNGHKKNEKKNV